MSVRILRLGVMMPDAVCCGVNGSSPSTSRSRAAGDTVSCATPVCKRLAVRPGFNFVSSRSLLSVIPHCSYQCTQAALHDSKPGSVPDRAVGRKDGGVRGVSMRASSGSVAARLGLRPKNFLRLQMLPWP